MSLHTTRVSSAPAYTVWYSRPAILVVAVVLGIGLALGQAPWGLAFSTCAALVIGFQLWPHLRTRGRRMLAAWGAGLGYFATVMHWIVYPFLVDAALHGWMAPLALSLMTGGLALFWMVAGLVAHPLSLAAAIALAELARGYVLTGLPWGQLSYTWVGTWVYGAAAWIGPYGLTLVMLLGAAGLARLKYGAGLGAMIGALAFLPIGDIPTDDASIRPIVRMVQPNAEQALKWDPAHRDRFFGGALAQSAAPSKSGESLDLIVWPETSLPNALSNADRYLAKMQEQVGATPMIVGAVRWPDDRPRNSAVLVQDGQATQVYDKRHLVPFGEYTPLWGFASFLGFDQITGMPGPGFGAGTGPTHLQVDGIGELRVLICYEGIFPQEILGDGPRPRAIVLITNDAWFGPWAGPRQHLAQAQARAVETGLPIIRVANTGITAMIDAQGRLTTELPSGVLDHADAVLGPSEPATPYSRFGDLPVALFALLLLVSATLRSWFRD